MGARTNRAIVGGLLCLVALLAGAGAGMLRRPVPTPRVNDEATANPTTSAESPGGERIEVHVAGAVVSPGVVVVDEGAIVADAIAAAGGMVPEALADALNLAAPLAAGQQIVVPGSSGASTQGIEGAAPGPAAGGGGPMSLSTAAATDLEALPGVGPVLAARIVDFREENGPFETVEDLLEIPGIGEAKLASIRDLVVP